LTAERAALEDARAAVRADLARAQAARAELADHEPVVAEPVAERLPEPALPALDRVLAGLSGTRLCFGDPIEAAGRTLVPVARVRGAGGIGRRGPGAPGGGGRFDARPIGVLEIDEDGTRFERLPGSDAGVRARAAAAVAAAALLTGGATAVRALRRRRPAPRRPSLPRSLRR
jgi:hypothetical protein